MNSTVLKKSPNIPVNVYLIRHHFKGSQQERVNGKTYKVERLFVQCVAVSVSRPWENPYYGALP